MIGRHIEVSALAHHRISTTARGLHKIEVAVFSFMYIGDILCALPVLNSLEM